MIGQVIGGNGCQEQVADNDGAAAECHVVSVVADVIVACARVYRIGAARVD